VSGLAEHWQMVRRRREVMAGDLEANRVAAYLGAELKRSRRRRRLTLEQLASRVGIHKSRLQELEAGNGASAPVRLWFAIGMALERPFAAGFSREILPSEPADSGHLAGQEIVLGLARAVGRTGLFELRPGRHHEIRDSPTSAFATTSSEP
jgi:transcriptional regulator with XRE-family HTH domain